MRKHLIFAVLLLLNLALFAENRNALLIANGDYQHLGNLATPIKEARDLKKTLVKLGFSVTILENAGKDKILSSLYNFKSLLAKKGGIGFFHYGGHAVQVKGENFLIPVDSEIQDEEGCDYFAIKVDSIMASMVADTNIVILDACRDNPIQSSGRSATRGLVLTQKKPKNSIIVYSADAGESAYDGLFTPILTKKLLEKKELLAVLQDVRKDVYKKSNGKQMPGEYNGLIEDVYLAGYATTSNQNYAPPKQTDTKTAEEYYSLGKKEYDAKNDTKAVEYYQKAANLGHADAQCFLGYCYENGQGVPQNYAKAAEWYTKAAEQGYALAQHNLGVCYKNGQGVPRNYIKAVKWYTKAAEQGVADAQYNLGYCYYFGQGVTQNYAKAVEWYTKAAEQGEAVAQCNLGVFYENGNGVPQNYTKAVEWYTKAANQGQVNAQFNLGLCYELGKGVSKNLSSALYWYKKAAAQGHERAKRSVKELEGNQ